LRAGQTARTFSESAAEMLRLGLMDGERLRRMADEVPDGA